ncbi:MAG: DUF4392 domain-containing protein [Ruminococcaceae bacterium]|nr:DUF4392 domain-containing protein [Oscillospiraceae bacterium]
MTQQEITVLNLGQSLDDLANLDPRGYGVCKILYKASREYTGGPTCMNAAQKLVDTVKEGDFVYVMTGFVLRPFKKAETDGIISSMLLCRALVKAFGAKPILICPQENYEAVKNMAPVVGLHLFENAKDLQEIPVSMGVVVYTKDADEAAAQADELIAEMPPSAVISIECPGANDIGVYHNAVGLDVTPLEAKQDILFEKLQKKGILNIAIGDLGNEIGMGAIRETLNKYIPYAGAGACRCGCNAGLAVKTAADNLITATVSDWGCYAMIAAMAFLLEDVDIMHSEKLEKDAIMTASNSGMIDMYGWLVPAIDGFDLKINLPIVTLMREMVKNALALRETCKTWFEKVEELHYFG